MPLFNDLISSNEGKIKELGISLNPPATPEEIGLLEKTISQALPKDLMDFYRYCNGFESTDWLFRIVPIREMLEHRKELNFHFAEYMIYSDTWILRIRSQNEYYILNDNHNTGNTKILTNSIVHFTERYLHGGGVFGNKGLYKWFEEV